MMKKITIFGSLAVLFLCLDLGCAGRQKASEPVFKGEPSGKKEAAETLEAPRITVRSVPSEEGPFQHPFTVSETTLDDLLRSLYFQKKSTLSWKNPERMLTNAEASVLASRAASAFSDLSPNQLIDFCVVGRDGETTGELFVKGNCLNFRILTLEGYTFLKKGTKATPHQWKLTPQAGQGFFPSHAMLWNPKEVTNWVVVKISDLPTMNTGSDQKPGDKPLMKRLDVFP